MLSCNVYTENSLQQYQHLHCKDKERDSDPEHFLCQSSLYCILPPEQF